MTKFPVFDIGNTFSSSSKRSLETTSHVMHNSPGNFSILCIENMAEKIFGQPTKVVPANEGHVSGICGVTSASRDLVVKEIQVFERGSVQHWYFRIRVVED